MRAKLAGQKSLWLTLETVDDNLEEFAQLENIHILLQLVGARPSTGDPLALTERIVTTTEQLFGWPDRA
jgi:hypothetical protein